MEASTSEADCSSASSSQRKLKFDSQLPSLCSQVINSSNGIQNNMEFGDASINGQSDSREPLECQKRMAVMLQDDSMETPNIAQGDPCPLPESSEITEIAASTTIGRDALTRDLQGDGESAGHSELFTGEESCTSDVSCVSGLSVSFHSSRVSSSVYSSGSSGTSGPSVSSSSSGSSGTSGSSGSSESSIESSIDGSSYDISSSNSDSSSVLTSSLSSFEFPTAMLLQGSRTTVRDEPQSDEESESSNDDDLANLISATMGVHGIALGQALAERASCIDSIKWLGQHLPETVVQFLIDEIEGEVAAQRGVTIQSDSSSSEEGSDTTVSNAFANGTIPLEESSRESHARLHDHDIERCCLHPDESDSDDYTPMRGPLHLQDNLDIQGNEHSYQLRRRHSVIGGPMTNGSCDCGDRSHDAAGNHLAKTGEFSRRMTRRSSMPSILRNMESIAMSNVKRRSTRSSIWYTPRDSLAAVDDNQGSNSSIRTASSGKHSSNDYSAKDSSERSQESGSLLASNAGRGSLELEHARPGVGVTRHSHTTCKNFKSIEEDAHTFVDPFPFDSEDEKQKIDRLRERRIMKTRDSIRNLYSDPPLDQRNQASHLDGSSKGDGSIAKPLNSYFTDDIPPATRHDCALLFVDISGFTKLSTTLGVEPLSKTINSYFQKIVDMVEAFGGDILKFAGDALFAEWQASPLNTLELGDGVSVAGSSQCSTEPWHGLGLEECVLTAAACGARIVVECSDYPVYESGGTSGKLVTSLNVHCGVGFGEVVGVHVGDKETRMEYLILGDPIEQVAEAIEIASRGEVVASPEALIILEESAILDRCILDSDRDEPQVIATKSTCFFHPKGTVHMQTDWTLTLHDVTTKPRERLAKRCDDWDLLALKRLKQRMSLYVHPVVVNDEFAMKVYPGDRNRAQERHRSEAELRGVLTVFIMPLITARLTGDDTEDCKVLVLLNDIMLIMTRELARFKGQMRQFIVDDKGVVLIANFGLRGSTFPNMVAERAIPFTTTFQSLLKTELNTECQMGATYGMAYCGVVGGVSRHEYAVLGPSVNLAARLMANPDNRGFLVDDSVKDKAGSRQFRARPPVKAKGYTDLVPIFEPIQADDRKWIDTTSSRFVAREKEIGQMVTSAEYIVDGGGPSRFVLVSGEAGAGKSALCLQSMNRISDTCISRAVPHLILRSVFSEGDAFVPFSLARPIFLDILVFLQDLHDLDQDGSGRELHDSNSGIMNGSQISDASQSVAVFVKVCEIAEIPEKYIDIIVRLIVTRSRNDPLVDDDTSSYAHSMVMNSIAHYLVKAFLQSTIACDLVVLALDDVAQMDSMSWKVVQLLHTHSQNLLIIGTSRPMTHNQEMHADSEWWHSLHDDEQSDNKFLHIELLPMHLNDVEALIANSLGRLDTEVDPRISQEVYVQSGGMPHLASELLENLYKKNDVVHRWENGSTGEITKEVIGRNDLDVGKIGELVLHRMDSLPASVRTHLNLGAILGSSFELMDVISVFEQYRGVKREERLVHAKSVHESLNEAVLKGILEIVDSDFNTRYGSFDHPYVSHNVTYMFTHDVWRSNILRLTLDEWKRDMHSLIAQSMETVMDTEFANDYRLLTKLFCHWKESGSAEKAATLALKMGRSLETIGLTRQALVVYHESFDMWKAMDSTGDADDSIGGLSMQLLESMEASEVEHVIRLNVSLGRCYTQILDPKESIKAYQTALNFIHKAPSSVDLVDRSIIFPVFSGLFVALRFGHNEDTIYEQGLVRMFLRETKLYNDFHFSRALAMQAEMLGRHGKFELALQTAMEMKELYHVEEHSNHISQAYGSDRCGQCIAQSALWNYHLGNTSEALEICDHVLRDLLPFMDPRNVSNSFQMIYPLIWIMKDNDRALDAKEAFHEYVVKNYLAKLDERGLTSDRPLHMPLMALLDLIASSCETDQLPSYIEWAMIEKNGLFGSELNFAMGSCGRTADSIAAEICLLLAKHVTTASEKAIFVRKGFELARDAIELTEGNEGSKGMMVAYKQVLPIFDLLEDMHRLLPPEGRSRRLSCRW